jgi:hypothetical protein
MVHINEGLIEMIESITKIEKKGVLSSSLNAILPTAETVAHGVWASKWTRL